MLHCLSIDQTRMRVDESWQARVCMSVSSTLIVRSNEQGSCMRVDESLSFQFLCFCLLLPRFLSLRFLTLVKLLTVRVITPTVTCR